MEIESPDHFALRKDFRYFHEPIPEELSKTWVVGRSVLAQELADRIMLSRGGAFLVSGLRGVGKTTCVRLAIQLIRMGRERFARFSGDVELVDVWINLARPLEPVQLLHHLIRHLYLRLKEMRLLERLNRDLREDLKTAFLRTSFEISSRSLLGEERNQSTEAGFGKAPWLGLEFLGKISSSYKKTRSDEEALKYLPYDEKAAEFDILSLSRRLLTGLQTNRGIWQRWCMRLGWTYNQLPFIKVVFVLDELDKLEGDAESGKSPLDPVLQGLKSVFTASGFSFVFIAGKEVEEHLLEDVSRGDSIYESIFAYDLYLPCLWEEQDDIVLRCLELDGGRLTEERDTLALYLRYKGRGVPRRTWRELNKHVLWGDEGPVLTLDVERRRYMDLFAKVEEALEGDESFKRSRGIVDRAQFDRQKLCFYYTIDWVFSRGQEPFGLSQVAETVRTLNLGGANEVSMPDRVAQSVIDLLLARAFVERADREMTRLGQVGEDKLYRLAPWVLLVFQGAREKQWVPDEATAASAQHPHPVYERIGRFRVINKIGEGGFAEVYRVTDGQGRPFAAKILHSDLPVGTARVEALFYREIQALQMIHHPGVVRLYDSGEEQQRPYLVMDLLEGISLRHLLDNFKTLDPGQACAIAAELAAIFGYVHGCGLVRLDIKPSNIFLTKQEQIKVIDLGIATLTNSTRDGSQHPVSVMGTPGYMAPEQTSTGYVDARTDIFALGVILYEMLTGQMPFGAYQDPFDRTAWEEPRSASQFAEVSADLDLIVLKALAKDPVQRFQTMDEFAKALTSLVTTNLSEVIQQLTSRVQEKATSNKESTCIPFDSVLSSAEPGMHIPLMPPFRSQSPRPPGSKRTPARCPVGHLFDPSKYSQCPFCPMESYNAGMREAQAGTAHVGRTDADADSMDNLMRLVHDGRASVQEGSFGKLCRLSSLAEHRTFHLLFDFARQLCLWGQDGQVLKIVLTGEPLTMGRNAAEVNLPLEDPSVSRQHVAFFLLDNAVEVEDLSTANGTFLNGKRIRREKLSDRDSLGLGASVIVTHVLARHRTLIIESEAAIQPAQQ